MTAATAKFAVLAALGACLAARATPQQPIGSLQQKPPVHRIWQNC